VLEFLFDLPLVVVGPAILAVLWLFALAGLLLVRRRILPRLQISIEDSEFSGTMVQSVIVFYGLAVALIAVNVFQTYSDTAKIVSGEATCLAALYRDVGGYPEPARAKLQGELRDYVRQVIDEAWPLQRRGQVPTRGVEHMNRFQALLDDFEPATERQKLVHGETLATYDRMTQARRLRVDAVNTGLPGVMWAVIVLGAFIGVSSTFFFRVPDARLHAIQVLLLASFIGLVIFMILALDRPFRGDLGLGSEPYRLIYDQLMREKP
jgi:hypothetical protein